MVLWFSLIEYDPDYVVLKKCNNRNGKNSNNNRTFTRIFERQCDSFLGNTLVEFFTHFRMQEVIRFLIVVLKSLWQNDNGRWYKTMAMSIHVHHGF
jgi:hypothetical protein